MLTIVYYFNIYFDLNLIIHFKAITNHNSLKICYTSWIGWNIKI